MSFINQVGRYIFILLNLFQNVQTKKVVLKDWKDSTIALVLQKKSQKWMFWLHRISYSSITRKALTTIIRNRTVDFHGTDLPEA